MTLAQHPEPGPAPLTRALDSAPVAAQAFQPPDWTQAPASSGGAQLRLGGYQPLAQGAVDPEQAISATLGDIWWSNPELLLPGLDSSYQACLSEADLNFADFLGLNHQPGLDSTALPDPQNVAIATDSVGNLSFLQLHALRLGACPESRPKFCHLS